MNVAHSESYDLSQPADPRRTAIAWVCSMIVHAGLCGVAVFTYQRLPEGIAPEHDSRSAGIALVREIDGLAEYFGEDGEIGELTPTVSQPASPEQFLPPASELAIDLSGLMRQASAVAQPGQVSLSGRAGDVSASAAPHGKVGTARTRVFGIEGEGNRFIYVFDRSGSMDGFDARPLRAAQAELLNSLDDLQRTHQFQIIFYNEKPRVFNPGGGRPQMMWGDDASKRLARAFVSTITAMGSTDHLAALRKALALSPDVIFFLTDADEPSLSTSELQTVERLNRGCVIHAIEFGLGPQRSKQNFLARLAAQNFGQHVYVNIRDLRN